MKEKKPKKEKKEKKKKEKIIYIDDGRTVVDMDLEGYSWHGRGKRKKDAERPRFKEKLAIIWGAYRAYFPALLICLLSLALVFVLFKLWLGA